MSQLIYTYDKIGLVFQVNIMNLELLKTCKTFMITRGLMGKLQMRVSMSCSTVVKLLMVEM